MRFIITKQFYTRHGAFSMADKVPALMLWPKTSHVLSDHLQITGPSEL